MMIVEPEKITPERIISTNLIEDDAPAWDAAREYAASELCIVDHELYMSNAKQAGKYPPDNLLGDTPAWIALGATNAMKQFDDYVGTQTIAPEGIDETLDATRCDTVAMLEMSARKVRFVVSVKDRVYLDKEIRLIESSSRAWSDYFFGKRRYKRAAICQFPRTFGTRVRIIVPGSCKIGKVVIGQSRQVGDTITGVEMGLLDYSTKETDKWGRTSLKQGAFAKYRSFPIKIENTDLEYFENYYSDTRATPLLFVGGNKGRSGILDNVLMVYGYYKTIRTIIPGPIESDCTLDVNGLI